MDGTGTDASSRVTEAIQNLAADVHGLSRRLHPSMLHDLGLASVIESECRETSKRTGLATQVHLCEPMPEMSDDVRMTLFRIFQESMRNVEKHSRAASVEILLEPVDAHWIVLRVTDTGRGFDPGRRNGGLGLVSMRERARLVGGRLQIKSRLDHGTSVEVRAPCRQPSR